MKRNMFYFIFLIMIIQLVSSMPVIHFQNEEIRKGETAIATITVLGNFSEKIRNDQISFLDGRKKISIESEIYFYNNTHYLAIYPSILGNITMQISNILYSDGGKLKSDTLNIPLNISDSATFSKELNKTVEEVLSIRPGVFYSSSSPKIKLTNKGGSVLNISYLNQEISLDPMQSNTIELNPLDIFSTLSIDSYKTFEVPIIYFSAGNNSYSAPQEQKLRFSPEIIFDNIFLGDIVNQSLELFNFGEDNITNIQISSDSNITSIENPLDIPAKTSKNISIIVSPTSGGHVSGKITFNYTQFNKNWSKTIPLSIFVLPKNNTKEDFFSESQTCSDINGKVCPQDCSGKATFTKDGSYCCLGTCIDKVNPFEKSSSSSGWIIGVILLLILGLVGFFGYKRFKKSDKLNPQDQFKQTVNNLSKRPIQQKT